jgi:hypothetical protein
MGYFASGNCNIWIDDVEVRSLSPASNVADVQLKTNELGMVFRAEEMPVLGTK